MLSLLLAPVAATAVVQGIRGDDNVSRSMTSRLGRATVQSYCLPCHSLSAVTDVRLRPQEWREVIEEMVEIGAEIPPGKREIIYRYLVDQFSSGRTKSDDAPPPLHQSSGLPDAARIAPAEETGAKKVADMVAAGRRVYEDFGCDNCHTIDGIGGRGLKGPELGNAGSVLSRREILTKLEDPGVFYADGFKENHEENTMPLYDLTVGELNALAAYLGSLRDGRLHTPRAIVPKAPPGSTPGPDALPGDTR